MVKQSLVGSAVIALLAGGLLLSMATPSSEAVRLRNALLFDIVHESALDWTPDNTPSDFKLERNAAPGQFKDIISALEDHQGSDIGGFEFGRLAGERLAEKGLVGGAIQSTAVNALSAILDTGTGYCADYTQVMNGLAHAAGVPVREWGMSFDGYGGDGHAFSEVFDESMEQWIFFDTFYSFYVVDSETHRPLSALEFRDRLQLSQGDSSLELVPLSQAGYRFKTKKMALDYYRRGADEFYLWNGNNVFQYDSSLLVKLGGKVSRSAEQLMAIISGVHPRILIAASRANSLSLEALVRTRRIVVLLVGVILASTIALLGAAIVWIRQVRRA